MSFSEIGLVYSDRGQFCHRHKRTISQLSKLMNLLFFLFFAPFVNSAKMMKAKMLD